VRFSINRELAVAVQNSRRVLVASPEKVFQSLSSHPIRERLLLFGNNAAVKKQILPIPRAFLAPMESG
jgi:hypothetical protein